ncbi:MAG TPA: hypothetical protein DCG19_07170 [Cryomorphaceae bacterium]|nr:hypothetical protein [Owenweeksia sp.]MBF97652.1 hypothetical protein [Owenweeksia sp.]HAD97171.1 hypothetical protein [Cryomorphaceae bacterium]HBF21281.1 hypothetical protein [Cryomorphaceae bacterium]HCQ16390.1 hypothetical protein [Cryomorphaceae bacterium]|tara:strand:- start:1140 stop:1382 length:243 start_codon:yes stop_codon:yes gene_type:complete
MKRIFGYLFIVVAVILSLGFILLLKPLVMNLRNFLDLLMGNGDAYDVGYFIGTTLSGLLYVGVTILFWFYGLRFIKTVKT